MASYQLPGRLKDPIMIPGSDGGLDLGFVSFYVDNVLHFTAYMECLEETETYGLTP
jgi:hypothetical protein